MSFNLIKEGMELSLKRGVRTKFGIQQLVEYETEVYRPLMGSSLRILVGNEVWISQKLANGISDFIVTTSLDAGAYPYLLQKDGVNIRTGNIVIL